MLLESVRKDRRLKKNQRIQYHLDKLRDLGLISITHEWEYMKENKPKIDYKKRTIQLPDLIGDLIK